MIGCQEILFYTSFARLYKTERVESLLHESESELLLPNLLFVDLVEVLKLMALSLHIQPIGRDQVWLPLDEMLGFLSCDIARRSTD